MKSAILLAATTLLGISAATANQASHGDPDAQVGKQFASLQSVRDCLKPLQRLEIKSAKDLTTEFEIGPEGEITPKKRTLMEVRVAGAACQAGSKHPLFTLAVNADGRWKLLFEGNDAATDSSEVLLRQVVEAGTRIDFAARAQNDRGAWNSEQSTRTPNRTVQVLTSGAIVRQHLPSYNKTTAERFLNQYVSDEGIVTVASRDALYLFELDSDDPSSPDFDLQDLVVVVTFKDVPE